jgi:hypothetical protein
MKRETYNGESAKSWHDAWETASRLHVAVMNDRDELQRQLDELRASVPVLETPPPQELTPIMKESIMKESMRLMNEVMALTVERDAILRRAEAAEADWQRCEAELKLRAPVEPVPAPRLECPTNHTLKAPSMAGNTQVGFVYIPHKSPFCPDCGASLTDVLSPPVGTQP